MRFPDYTRSEETIAALDNPVVGTTFHEMFSAWMGIVYVGSDGSVLEDYGDGDGYGPRYRYHATTIMFAQRHRYGSKGLENKTPWVLSDRVWPWPLAWAEARRLTKENG